MASIPEKILNLERGGLDRWGKGDPDGFLELNAPEVTYFDPYLERRLDGLAALTDWYEQARGKIRIDRDENPGAEGSSDRRCRHPDLPVRQPRERRIDALELHGGLPADRRRVENCALALVVHAAAYRSRRADLTTLPALFLGSAGTAMISLGTRCAGRRWRQNRISDS